MKNSINGELLPWLRDRFYDEEADGVGALSADKDSGNVAVKLAEIFGVQIEGEVDVDEIAERNERLERLRKITSDDEVLRNVDLVAFSQEDMDIVHESDVIYLCGEKFRIPYSVQNKRYIGVNEPLVEISAKGEIDLSSAGIIIQNCKFSLEDTLRFAPRQTNEAKQYENIDAEALYNEGMIYYKQKKYTKSLPLFKQAAELNHAESQYQYAGMLMCGEGTSKDISAAENWYRAAMNNGHVRVCEILGDIYRGTKPNCKELKDYNKALECYKLGAERGNLYSLKQLGTMYIYDYGFKDVDKGIEILLSAVSKGRYDALRALACYYESEGDYEKAIKYNEKYMPHAYNYENIMTDIAELYYKMNNIEQALYYYTKSAENDGDACKWLINYYKSKGNKSQAIKWYHYAWDKHALDESDIGFSEADLLLGGAFEGTAASEAVNNVFGAIKSFFG